MTTVLVVEDDASLRNLLAARLRASGFEAVTAASADEALALARARPPALIVSDYALGRQSGLDLLVALRAEGRSVPFVLTSVLFPVEVPGLAREAGAELVIEKSRLLGDVAGVVDRVLTTSKPHGRRRTWTEASSARSSRAS